MDKVSLDPRHWQILALSGLLIYSMAGFDFGASLIPSLVAIVTALATQAFLTWWSGRGGIDLRSPLITGLSLSLLLRTDSLLVTALAAVLAIGSKFLFRINGKHLWNPATFGITAVLLGTHHAWVSPGQWGTSLWVVTLIGFLAILVLSRAARWDTALAFLGTYAGLLVWRAVRLGDPMTIPLHQVQTGSLLLFAFFMVTDPKSTPDRALPRIGFAVAVATLAHWMIFSQQIRPALYLSLALLAPLVPVLDRLFPGGRFDWRSPPPSFDLRRMTGMLHGSIRGAARTAAMALGIAGGLAASLTPAFAFCGFYVAQADSKLFNKSSKVVLVRDGTQTAITMASDYEGDPKEFALVVPVPTVVAKDDIHVVDPAIITRLDSYTAPRLTEYFDEDPCPRMLRDLAMMAVPAPAAPAPELLMDAARSRGVTIEARYEVGVYDILILSAEQSDGLVSWLQDNNYKIPDGTPDVLGSYIRQSMHFFVAKVNLSRQAASSDGFLKPIEVRYESPKFMLPLRLGTVNANGPQDLIVYAITRNGRVETANYRPAKMETRVDVPLFTRTEFGPIYKAAFDRVVENDGMTSVYLEYAWDLGAYCDPCAGTPPEPSDLYTLGAKWQMPDESGDTQGPRRFYNPGGRLEGFVTRLHVRYDREHFPEDLALTETHDREPFQVVYAMHHPFTGKSTCAAGDDYLRGLPDRFSREARNLAHLTGWQLADIKQKMEANGEDGNVQVPSFFERLFRKNG